MSVFYVFLPLVLSVEVILCSGGSSKLGPTQITFFELSFSTLA